MRPEQVPQAAGSERPPADDWYGVWDAKERRRRQNRVNQRAHRLRTRYAQGHAGVGSYLAQWYSAQVQPMAAVPSLLLEPTHQPQRISESLPEQVKRLESTLGLLTESRHTLSAETNQSSDANKAALSAFMASHSAKVSSLCLKTHDAEKRAILLRKVAQFHNSYQLNCPSADHLLSLTRVNVYRAFVAHMVILGITWEWMEDESISPFFVAGPPPPPLGFEPPALPEKLQPTHLQRTSIHHTWIDLFPCPVMRDNLIRRGNEWDDEELCVDIMGYWDGNSTGPHGLIVWGEPADLANWEVTEGFLCKWGWLVRGCVELMRSTNHWRERRGLGPLFSKSVAYSQ
ncbi:hypothetical protein ASPCAL04491 [Aspergillus calidoustus]|uniref:BZIP domain-containing protein n=1 Tax=Aspergillus calidoustus TaxID=454130 RepID=A0A0U5FX83_ASPCI|nr:hypothetical protein ASPCAL04491 [Aspergillus calidoustus]